MPTIRSSTADAVDRLGDAGEVLIGVRIQFDEFSRSHDRRLNAKQPYGQPTVACTRHVDRTYSASATDPGMPVQRFPYS